MVNNNDGQIVLGLDIPKTVSQINDDIKKLQGQLDQVKATGALDTSATVKQINAQIATLQAQLNNINIQANVNMNNSTKTSAQQTGQQIGKLISDSAEQAISRVSSPAIGRYFKIDSSTSNQFRTEMEKLVSEWTNAKGKLTDINIQTRTSYDKDADENITRLHQATVTYKNELDEVIKKTIAWRQIGTTTNAKGEEQVLRGFVEVAGQYSKSIDTITAKTDTFVDKQKKAVGSLTSTLASIKSGYDDKNASKPIKLQSNIDKLEEQYTKVETAIKAVGQANKSTFTDAEVEANRLISELRDMVKEYRNAENVSTKMKGTDFTSGLSIAKNDLEKFKADAKDFPQITQTIKDLDTAIGKVGDASSLNKFNDELRVARSELAKIKSETSATNKTEKVGINTSGLQSKIADLQKISPEIDKFETEINGAKVTVQSLLTDLSKINTQGDFSVVNAKFNAFTKAAEASGIAIRDFGNVTDSIAEKVNKIQLLSNGGIKNDYATQIAKLEGNFRSLGLTQDTINTKTQNVKNSLATLRAEFAKPVDQQNFQAIQTANDNLQRELIESTNEFERLRASMKGMATEQQRLSLANTIEAWNQKNTAATRAVVDENHRYILTLRDLNTQVSQMQLAQMNTAFKQNENSMRALNKLGASLKVQFKQAAQSFTMWLSASTAVMRVISETREAYNQLKEVNTILTEISKTNHSLTSSDLVKIADNGFDVASKYGKTVTDYLSGVKDMSRAGYKNAEAMGELSTAVQGAGDMTADVANKMIIATDKAYKLGGSVEELTKILDGMNWISDNNAVNMTELSEGMSIVGSTAASFGVEVNELTAALATMSATTQQSGSEVARAFRAILLNIRQVSDEEEGIDAEGLTKYEKACNALGVSLKETVNGVLQTRDAMEVLEDLSIAYNKLDANDLRRTNLLNSVGGKLRSTQLDALLRQFDTYKTMLQQFEDGTGTMAFEADKTAKSWEGSLNRLKNTWADTIENIANSDAIISIINGLNGIISGANKLTDALGSIGSIGLGVGLFAGIKNVGKRRSTMFHNCFEYADRDKCFLYEIGFLSPIVKYTLVNEATISVEII